MIVSRQRKGNVKYSFFLYLCTWFWGGYRNLDIKPLFERIYSLQILHPVLLPSITGKIWVLLWSRRQLCSCRSCGIRHLMSLYSSLWFIESRSVSAQLLCPHPHNYSFHTHTHTTLFQPTCNDLFFPHKLRNSSRLSRSLGEYFTLSHQCSVKITIVTRVMNLYCVSLYLWLWHLEWDIWIWTQFCVKWM